MKMYLVMEGKRKGPYDPEDVKALYDSGEVCGEDLAWKAGMDDWKPLKELFPEWVQEPEEQLTPVSLSSASESIDPSPVPEESDTKPASSGEEGEPKAEEVEEQASESADEAVTEEEIVAGEAAEPVEVETATPEDGSPDEAAKPAEKPAMPHPDKLYLGIDGERRGPLSSNETTALLLSGEVKEDNLAWKSGMKEWKPLKEVWPDCMKVASDSETAEKTSDISLLHKLQSAFRKK